MKRCDFTDLEQSMCAHCRPPPATPAPEPGRPSGRWLHSIYPGSCASCRTAFTAGTPIRMHIPDGWIANCCDTPTW